MTERWRAYFEARVRKIPDGCWIWMGCRDRNGYGVICTPGRIGAKAHRLAWELGFGKSPGRSWVLHRCDNPGCVRLDHLFIGDCVINVADRHMKGRDARGERQHLAKLTVQDVRTARRRFAAGESYAAIARTHGMHYTTLHDAIHGNTWSHINDPDPVPLGSFRKGHRKGHARAAHRNGC